MIRESAVVASAGVRLRRRAADFIELTKPRVVTMILITTCVGFYLGSPAVPDLMLLVPALIGTALAAGGTLTLNQYMERDIDALMQRTRLRPLPDGRMRPAEALAFGIVTTAAGLLFLATAVNPLSALVAGTITVTYLMIYTPMKRRSPFCSILGAVPGALPPVIGWTAAQNAFGIEAWILFAILFLWQLPHSLAIGQLYRDDYARAGLRLLPVVESDGHQTAKQVVNNCLALLAVGLLPAVVGLAGAVYFVAALILGSGFLAYGIHFSRHRTEAAARRLLFASLIYLPALLVIMAADKSASPWSLLG
jgi:protoheme IX farnesyltransferase